MMQLHVDLSHYIVTSSVQSDMDEHGIHIGFLSRNAPDEKRGVDCALVIAHPDPHKLAAQFEEWAKLLRTELIADRPVQGELITDYSTTPWHQQIGSVDEPVEDEPTFTWTYIGRVPHERMMDKTIQPSLFRSARMLPEELPTRSQLARWLDGDAPAMPISVPFDVWVQPDEEDDHIHIVRYDPEQGNSHRVIAGHGRLYKVTRNA